jgi:hypothetical protein
MICTGVGKILPSTSNMPGLANFLSYGGVWVDSVYNKTENMHQWFWQLVT